MLALVRGYARSGKPFDGSIHRALSKTVVDEQQEPGTSFYQLHPVSVAPLRKALFAMLNDNDPHIAALAEECLGNIDFLRDYMGPAESEPRHPDIASGRPWPRAAE